MSTATYSDLESALVRYCTDHPDAADSIEGVRRWWLVDPALPLVELESALDALVARGVLEARPLLDGTTLYFSRAASVPRS